MRLRKFEPNEAIDDIVVNENEFYTDPDAVEDAQIFNRERTSKPHPNSS